MVPVCHRRNTLWYSLVYCMLSRCLEISSLSVILVYDDPRFGDRYEIDLSDNGDFLSAVRFVDKIGRDPIVYDALSEIPQPHRNEIEQRIWTKIHPTYNKQR